jgi:hypothetical protein
MESAWLHLPWVLTSKGRASPTAAALLLTTEAELLKTIGEKRLSRTISEAVLLVAEIATLIANR